jgi:Fe-S oxidoreductase
MACNEYCEKGARPFDLISARQEAARALAVPGETLAFFEQIEQMPSQVLPGTNKKKVLSLCALAPVLSPAHIAHPLFSGLTVAQGGDYFCHIAKLHLAQPSVLETIGRKFIENLQHLQADEIVFFHDECYAMVHKMIHDFGYEVSFKPIHLLEHINDYLRRQPAAIVRQNLKVAYQRPCSSRLGPDTEQLLDDFFSLTGAERVNRKYDRKNALCCGSALAGLGRMEAARDFQILNLQDAKENGAEAIIYLCPMCGVSLATACHDLDLKCLSVMELIQTPRTN